LHRVLLQVAKTGIAQCYETAAPIILMENRAIGVGTNTAKHDGPDMRYFGIDNDRRMIPLIRLFAIH
jgi:hypothetical protein